MHRFDPKQARRVVELMVLSAWADGHVEGSEALIIQRQVSSNPMLEGVGVVSEIARETRRWLLADGMDACLGGAAAELKDRDYRELAFQCCARVMGADRSFPLEEETVLGRLQNLLGVTDADASRLLVLATR
ncbi:MAG TPA: tellurite resistance TerB family protein [Myxococcales bacterium]|nr:tellurite resistance TerB family protein [Myxococcales bacterium]